MFGGVCIIMAEALRDSKYTDAKTYVYYFTGSWQPILSPVGAVYKLVTNIPWDQMVARPVGSTGRDINGRIAPFASDEAMWAFIRSTFTKV
jgi:hypothetical protein